jgi:hypothetical protein
MTGPPWAGRAAVGFLVHAASLPRDALGPRINLSMPGVCCTVGEQIASLRRIAGERIGARQDRKGILLPDAVECSNGFQHRITTCLSHALRTIAGVSCLIEGAPTCCIMA